MRASERSSRISPSSSASAAALRIRPSAQAITPPLVAASRAASAWPPFSMYGASQTPRASIQVFLWKMPSNSIAAPPLPVSGAPRGASLPWYEAKAKRMRAAPATRRQGEGYSNRFGRA